MKAMDAVQDMDKDEVAEEKHTQSYAPWVAQLYPLLDKGFELSTIGESKVEGRPVVGVKVARKGHRDINLYFDKENSTLLRLETRSKDVMGGGGEVAHDVIYNGYKDVGGIKEVQKFTIKRDGKVYLDFEFTDFHRKDKLDDSVFKP
jgi:hypothetical protein